VLLATVFVAAAAGNTCGLHVRDVSNCKHEISTKVGNFSDASIMLVVLSHHSVFYLDGKVIAIPTTEITMIAAQKVIPGIAW
jgi:hypothetical protein